MFLPREFAYPLKKSLPGYFCSVKKSSILLRCGVFSYNQVVAIPDTEVSVHLTGAQCDTMVQESVYRSPDGRLYPYSGILKM